MKQCRTDPSQSPHSPLPGRNFSENNPTSYFLISSTCTRTTHCYKVSILTPSSYFIFLPYSNAPLHFLGFTWNSDSHAYSYMWRTTSKKKNDDKTKWYHYDKINDSIDDDNNVVIIWINLFAVEVKYLSSNHA